MRKAGVTATQERPLRPRGRSRESSHRMRAVAAMEAMRHDGGADVLTFAYVDTNGTVHVSTSDVIFRLTVIAAVTGADPGSAA